MHGDRRLSQNFLAESQVARKLPCRKSSWGDLLTPLKWPDRNSHESLTSWKSLRLCFSRGVPFFQIILYGYIDIQLRSLLSSGVARIFPLGGTTAQVFLCPFGSHKLKLADLLWGYGGGGGGTFPLALYLLPAIEYCYPKCLEWLQLIPYIVKCPMQIMTQFGRICGWLRLMIKLNNTVSPFPSFEAIGFENHVFDRQWRIQ